MAEFTNKIAVVTGGTSGIGLAIAGKLQAQGAKVAIFGKNPKKLQDAASSLHALPIQGDVANLSDLKKLYQETKKKLGGIDILVACAGIAETRHVKDVDEEFFDKIVAVNYKGLYFSVQKALAFLNPGASIILISSAAAHVTWPEHSVYSSTKAAVSYLGKSFASDLLKMGIRVNTISPGFTDTPMTEKIQQSPEIMEQVTSSIPMKRFGSAEDIANAAVFLASSKSSYMTGAEIVIDGGLSEIYPLPT